MKNNISKQKRITQLKNRAMQKADNYMVDLQDELENISRLAFSKKKYSSWSLQDCKDILNFCLLISEEEDLKKAFRQLYYLYQVCGLVPYSIYKDLWDISKLEGYNHLWGKGKRR